MIHILKLLIFLCLIFPSLGFAEVRDTAGANAYDSTGQTALFVEVGWLWGPSNFEECVVENSKGVSSELAVKGIMMACIKLFPRDKNSTPISSRDEGFYNCLLKNLKGIGNDSAAKLAIVNCRQKYQEK